MYSFIPQRKTISVPGYSPFLLGDTNSPCIVHMYAFLHRHAVKIAPPLTMYFWLIIQSPDGKRVAMSSDAGQIFIFDLESETLATTFTSHAMSVRSLAWSPDSSVSQPIPDHFVSSHEANGCRLT